MAVRKARLTEFTTDIEPLAGVEVELLCEDHNGTYVLPFPCYRAEGEWHNKTTGDVLQVETGSLYPALHRLERQKWIVSQWRITEQNQRAKFYELTADGKEQLVRDRSRWEAMVQAIAGVLSPIPEPKA